MATVILAISYDGAQNAASIAARLAQPAHARMEAMIGLSNELAAIAGGAHRANVTLLVESGDDTRTVSTITLGGAAITAGDKVTIGGVPLEWAAAPADENEVKIGANDAENAANLAAAINAHSIISGLVSAKSDGVKIVTVTSALPGNYGVIVTVGATVANSGAIVVDLDSWATSATVAPPRTYNLGG